MNPSPFGEHLRAARLGFGWDETRKLWIRMSDLGPSEFLVEVASQGNLPSNARGAEHRCWWEGTPEERERLLQACSPVARLSGFMGFMSWVVDEDGQETHRRPGRR